MACTSAALQSHLCRSQDPASLDISGALVSTAYRSTPWAAEQQEAASSCTAARVLLVSESGVCRSALAAAALRALAERHGLAGEVECDSRATRDYSVGESPHPAAQAAAAELGLALPEGLTARVFDGAADIVTHQLVVVMDKYTVADVLREVSVFDTISSLGGSGGGRYSRRVRRLGEFHPRLGASRAPDGADIEDPLYGGFRGLGDRRAHV